MLVRIFLNHRGCLMSFLNATEFIHLYESASGESLEWLEKKSMDLKTLFNQSADFTKLAAAHTRAFVKTQPNAAEIDKLIDALLEVARAQIATLYLSFEQLLKLNRASPSLAFTLFTYEPEHIISLLVSAKQFLELYEANQMLALNVFEHDKIRRSRNTGFFQ